MALYFFTAFALSYPHFLGKSLKKGVKVTANTVVMKQNENCMKETAEFIFSMTGRKGKKDVIRITDDSLRDIAPKSVKNTHIISDCHSFSNVTIKSIGKNMNSHSCWQGKINISCNGFVSPCIMWHQDRNDELSLKHHSLKTILDNQIIPYYWQLSKDKISVCNKCEYRYICFDCRPLVQDLSSRGNICKYNPYTQKWDCDLNLLKKYIEMPKVNYNKGKIKVAFVFSCPGKEEEKTGTVLSGKTGDNLDILLSYLSDKLPTVFLSSDKKDYTLTNASDAIHYKALNNNTEASLKEVLLPENLFRLDTELNDMNIIICMGKNAYKAVSAIHSSATIIQSEHLSNIHLNKNYRKDYFPKNKTPSERRKCRITLIGEKICDAINWSKNNNANN